MAQLSRQKFDIFIMNWYVDGLHGRLQSCFSRIYIMRLLWLRPKALPDSIPQQDVYCRLPDDTVQSYMCRCICQLLLLLLWDWHILWDTLTHTWSFGTTVQSWCYLPSGFSRPCSDGFRCHGWSQCIYRWWIGYPDLSWWLTALLPWRLFYRHWSP